MASRAPPTADHQVWPPLPTLTDELLEEIFLRLPTPTDLARAATACASFHRIITDRSFLRRFRAVHPPPLLGFVTDGFHAAEAPHPSAPLARALADAADFSYSFVPHKEWCEPWYPRDIRQGRVLLGCYPKCGLEYDFYDVISLRDLELAVCDPLYRRYVLLPPVPGELTAQHGHLVDFGIFLAPTGEDEEETSFRVICTARNGTKLLAFVFSTVTGQWRIAASPSWSSLGTCAVPSSLYGFSCFDCAHSCFYWTVPLVDKLIVLDALRMEFSIVNINNASLCQVRGHGQARIVASAEGTPLMSFFGDHNGDGSIDLLHFTKLNGSADQWQFEKTIPLPQGPQQYMYSTLGAAEGFLFLDGTPELQNSEEYPNPEYFALDIKTSELRKVCGMKKFFFRVHAYFGFPPSLSKPCI
ncbi:hypothetical protein ACP70R_004531 [Stipagrostis hirtigluma subsp. patula]